MIKLAAICILMVLLFIAMNSGTDDAYTKPAPGPDEKES